MTDQSKKYISKVGLPPGTLVYVGEQRTGKAKVSKIEFSTEKFTEAKSVKDELIKIPVDSSLTTWYDIHGVHDTALIEKVGKQFKLDNLILEDIVNTSARPKAEDFGNYLFLSFNVIGLNGEKKQLVNEQLSLVLGKHWLLSFHEKEDDLFNTIRNRIQQATGVIRTRKEDYIFYRLLDTVVDNYFLVTEYIYTELEVLEEKILYDPEHVTSQDIYNLKKLISELKNLVVPVREAISSIIRMDTDLISNDIIKFYRDVYEHIIQIIETMDQQREMANDFLNLYMSTLSNKMNQVMKVLTIFASIFIPLTFIAGVYGMNFEIMPELSWKYGYFMVWGIMATVAVALLIYFKRKKWL